MSITPDQNHTRATATKSGFCQALSMLIPSDFCSTAAFRPVVISTIVIACLSSGCAHSQLNSSHGTPIPFPQILQNSDKVSRDELKEQLRTLLSSGSVNDKTRQEAGYVLGRTLQKNGDNSEQKEALGLFDQASNDPPLWERSQWHLSECAAAVGQEKDVRRALQAIAERSADAETKASAEYGLAQSYLRGNEPDKARETFTGIRTRFPRSNFALGAAYYLAEMDIDNPARRSHAIDLFREYLRLSPNGHFARNIVTRLASLNGYTPSPADHALFGQVHFVQGEWQEALDEWKKAGAQDKWYERALCLVHLGHEAEAKQQLLSGIKAHPDSPVLSDAAGKACDLLSHDQCMSLWKDVLSKSTRYGDVALWNLAIRTDFSQSVGYYQQIVKKFPRSDFAPESSWWIFWDQVRRGQVKPALAQAAANEKLYAHTRPAARYSFWQGKLLEQMGSKESARVAYMRTAAQYPSSYYGWRAQARLSAMSGGTDRGWSIGSRQRDPEESWTWPRPPLLITYDQIGKSSGATVAVLVKLHQWDESLAVLNSNADPSLKSFLLAMVNLPVDAISVAEAGLSGKPGAIGRWQLAYPLLYAREISQASKGQNLDPLLVHALIREESHYNPMAISRSKAIGLMQLMTGTGYGIAKRIGISLSSPMDIYKPDVNIALGTNYLAYVLNRNEEAGGRGAGPLLAVAGYNGGPNAAQAWASRSRHSQIADWDTFVENIPFRETRDYVRKVFGSYWNYQAIYPPQTK